MRLPQPPIKENVFDWRNFGNDIHIGAQTELETKPCTNCGTEIPLGNYRLHRQRNAKGCAYYHSSICRSCESEVSTRNYKKRQLKKQAL